MLCGYAPLRAVFLEDLQDDFVLLDGPSVQPDGRVEFIEESFSYLLTRLAREMLSNFSPVFLVLLIELLYFNIILKGPLFLILELVISETCA